MRFVAGEIPQGTYNDYARLEEAFERLRLNELIERPEAVSSLANLELGMLAESEGPGLVQAAVLGNLQAPHMVAIVGTGSQSVEQLGYDAELAVRLAPALGDQVAVALTPGRELHPSRPRAGLSAEENAEAIAHVILDDRDMLGGQHRGICLLPRMAIDAQRIYLRGFERRADSLGRSFNVVECLTTPAQDAPKLAERIKSALGLPPDDGPPRRRGMSGPSRPGPRHPSAPPGLPGSGRSGGVQGP